MPCVAVTLLNQKGGVGKTSTTYHLGGTLAREGKRVLVVDVDPQASLTQGFEGPNFMRALPRRESVAALFGDGLVPDPDVLIRPTAFERLWLVPGSGHLTRHNVPEPHLTPPDQQRALADFLGEVRGRFDVILFDCPPNLHLCSWAALTASDYLVCPLQAEDFGSQGVAAILDCVDLVLRGANPRLKILGFLLTMYNPRLAIHKAYGTMLRDLYGRQVFDTTVPIGTDFKEAIAQRKPVAYVKPKGASAKSIKALGDELFARVAEAEAGDAGRARRADGRRPAEGRVMKKDKALLSRYGANLAESLGAGRGDDGAGGGSPPPAPAADRSEGTTRLRSAAEIAVDRLAPDPNQPRTEFEPEAIARLAESLTTHGQLQPIAVRWSEEAGRYLIVTGERRWRAAVLAGRPTVAAVILEGTPSDSRVLEMQLIENALREDLRPVEQARAYRTLMDRNGWTALRLSETLHLNCATVTRALALLDLPAAVQTQVEAGALAPSVAYEISKVDDPDARLDLADRVVRLGMNRTETIEEVRRTSATAAKSGARVGKGRAAPKPKKLAPRVFRTAAGRVTVELRRGDDPRAMLAAVNEVVKALEAEIAGRGQDAA